MEPVLILHIALASISLFACILQLIISFRQDRDLLFLVCAVLSAVIFISFTFSIIFSTTSTLSSYPLSIFRYQLIFTETIFLSMLVVIFYILNNGRRINNLINSSIFLLLLVFSIVVPDFVLFGESATTHKHYFPGSDSIYMLNAGFTVWRVMVGLTLILFSVSASLLIYSSRGKINNKTRLILWTGIGMVVIAGLYDQLVDLGIFNTAYVLPLAGFLLYMILSFIPFFNLLKNVNAQQDYKEREKKWQRLFNNTDLLVVALNRMGQVESLNPYFYELTGYTKEEVLGKDWFEFIIPPKEYYNVQGTFVEVLSYESHPHYMNPILTKNKEERMIRWFNVRIRDNEGIITGSLSIGVDVSDDIKEKDSIRRKLTEAENLIIELNEKIESP